ncbi:MAG: PDZ domain-containing protein [Dehalococcoidia bacterium]|nr:PDZ domain-containing protein [Dehalococcoidia bacterium]
MAVLAISCTIGDKGSNDLSTPPCVPVRTSASTRSVQPTPTPVATPPSHPWGRANWGVDPEITDQGLLVRDVTPATAAKEFGLVNGDPVVTINGQPISTAKQFNTLLASLKTGVWIRATWQRGDDMCSGSAILGAKEEVVALGGRVTPLPFAMELGSELKFHWEEYYGKDVDFSVRGPGGDKLAPTLRRAEHESSFTATKEGLHELVFDNASSRRTKVVYLYYQIRHPGK